MKTNLIVESPTLIKEAVKAASESLKNGQPERCEMLIKQVHKIASPSLQTKHLLALSLHRQGKNKESLSIIVKLAEDYPDNWELWNTLGVVASSAVRNRSKAIQYFKQASHLCPESPVPKLNLALEYHSDGQNYRAKEILEKMCSCGESNPMMEHAVPMAWFNLGNVLLDELNPAHANYCFKKCKKFVPDFHAATWNQATALFLCENYKEGWGAYESRWHQFPKYAQLRTSMKDRPVWTGEPLANKTILLYSEQGAGDTIQFARFIKHLKEQGATVIVEWSHAYVRGDLKTLLEGVVGVDRVVDPADEERFVDYDFDYHQSICSLPYVLKLYDSNDFRSDPYIFPDTSTFAETESYWERHKNTKKVGIVWAGSLCNPHDHKRSIPSIVCKYFAQEDKTLFSLQKGPSKRVWPTYGEIDLNEGLNQMPVVDLSHMISDYNSTANIISKMDAIVSVDTAVAHLAGAMGKPTILLLPYVPDWRWGLKKTSTPWYKNMIICRQQKPQNWLDAIQTAKEALNYVLDRDSVTTASDAL